MDQISMCQKTLDDARAMVAKISAAQLSQSTPCTEWNVKELLNHMIGVCSMFDAAITGTKPSSSTDQPDLVGSDHVASYGNAVASVMNAWRSPGALEKTLALPIGELPATVGININLIDQLVHISDLAKAIDVPYAMDPELAETALASLKQILSPDFRGPGKPFGPELPCPADASAQDRLLAFSGRAP